MRRKVYFLLALLLMSSTLFMACSSENAEADQKASINIEEEDSKNTDEVKDKQKEEEKEIEEEILPEESQQVTEFPWDESEDFKAALEENGTDVLIAGFATVSNNYTEDERENIDLASSAISGTVIHPGEVFSQNDTAGPYTEEKGYKEGENYVGGQVVMDFGGGVCNVSTALYNTSIASDLDIVERHNHSMPVPYVPYGQDAAVAFGYKDFKFKNDTEDPMLIWTELVDNILYMGFYGKEVAPEITWEHETLSETETTTEYRTNSELGEGEENILVDGMDGKVVESKLKIKDKDGEEKTKELGESAYNPKTNVIEKNE